MGLSGPVIVGGRQSTSSSFAGGDLKFHIYNMGGDPGFELENDDLIAQVRNKLNSGGKDIFAQCVNAVKAFLAGEPFREFESSMYFHRWVVLPFKE